MHPNRKLLAAGLATLTCCCLSLFYSLLGTERGKTSAHLNGQEQQDTSLRLESWGDCFQAAPALFLAAASLQADQVGRSHLRRAWSKWRIGQTTAHLMFYLRYSDTASRLATINEFHNHQDVIVDSRLPRQDDLAMLQASAAWFLERCPRTAWMLFAEHGAAVNPRLVSLHATGGVANGAGAQLPVGLASWAANRTEPGSAHLTASSPKCLLLTRRAAKLVARWPTTWSELFSIREFHASVRDATRLFCSLDVPGH